MRNQLLFLLLILLSFSKFSLANNLNIADTTINTSNYKQSKEFFLENYSKDDSTKALINYFFRKRQNGIYETFIPAAAAGTSALIFALALPQPSYLGLLIGLPLGIVIIEAPVYIIIGQVKWLIFTRKKLFKYLTAYNSGISLPSKVKLKKSFKRELEKLD